MEYQTRLKIDERPDLSASEKERELKKSMKGLDHALARGEGSPWYRSFIEYMPLTTARKVSCPALILQGDKDAHIPVDHAYLVAKVMRSSGNDNVTVIVFKNHNHLFLQDPNGNISGYADLLRHTNQISTDVLTTITDWLSLHLFPSGPLSIFLKFPQVRSVVYDNKDIKDTRRCNRNHFTFDLSNISEMDA